MLSRKDYVAVSDILSDHRCCLCIATEFGSGYEAGYKSHHKDLVGRLGDYFEKDNPLFDREKFNAACND